MKKNLPIYFYFLILAIFFVPGKTYAGGPIGKFRNVFVPAFGYYSATDIWDVHGIKIKGMDGTGFQSYSLNLFNDYGISRRLDFFTTLPIVYQTSKYSNGKHEAYGPTDLQTGLSYVLINARSERYLTIQASAIIPLYNKSNPNTDIGFGSFGSEVKLSFSGNLGKQIIKGCYFNTEIYYRRYFNNDGPNQYGILAFLGFALSKSNQVTIDAVAIKSVSLNRSYNTNVSSIRDFSLIKPSLRFGHRFNRRFSLFAGGFYTVYGRNTGVGYGTTISGIFHL